MLLAAKADTDGWHGKFKNAHGLTQQAMESALRNEAKETAAVYQALAALGGGCCGRSKTGRG